MSGNDEFKSQMIERHRPAFNLWSRVHELLDEVVAKPRTLQSAYSRALNLFLILAFKSHGSLYPLCVMGHGEDAATIAHRLLTIALPAGYLCAEESLREERGEFCLHHFWRSARDIVNLQIPAERREWWEKQYVKPVGPWTFWTFLPKGIDEQEDRFLANVSHCSARGMLLDEGDGTIQITTDVLVREILVYGTKYVLRVALYWNEHFALADAAKLSELHAEAVGFDFNAA
jgi:hypothetical protein